MTVFLRYTIAYFLLVTAVNLIVRGEFYTSSAKAILQSSTFIGHTERGLLIFLTIFAIAIYTSKSARDFVLRVYKACFVLVLCCIFLGAFSTMKTAMPLIVERFGHDHFFADPFMAELDRILHFGVDPWEFAHALTQWLGLNNFAKQASWIYGITWAIPAFYLPAILVLFGEDRKAFVHYATLYVFAWVILGNIAALLGNSAGPVFYDRVFETERFTALHPALYAGGLEGSFFGVVQEYLWWAYAEGVQVLGSGISAFPSLHLATSALAAIYMSEKGRALAVLGWSFVAAILFISVWNGYHYAIDGYFSIAAMYGMHHYLRRRSAMGDGPVVSAAGAVREPVVSRATTPAE